MSEQTKIIAFDNPIGKEPMECFVDSGQTVEEAFPDLSSQVEISVNGRIVPEKEYSHCVFTADDIVTMIRMPAGGDDGKNIARQAALLAVTIGATALTGGLGGAFVTKAGGLSLLGSATASAISLGGSLLVTPLKPLDSE